GAAASIYSVVAADQLHSLSCNVTATNSEGKAQHASTNEREVAGSKPENTLPPTISGPPSVGEELTCDRGGWSGTPAPTFTLRWLRDGTAIASATQSHYS